MQNKWVFVLLRYILYIIKNADVSKEVATEQNFKF